MPTNIYKVKNWDGFENAISPYFRLDRVRRQQYYFRGHTKASWELKPTLDRLMTFESALERDVELERVIYEFRRNALGLPFGLGLPETPRQWELLGRHHGLPTTILDWTQSVYVAAFFAAIDAVEDSDEPMAIWIFDREYFDDASKNQNSGEIIELFDDIEDFRFNIRAIEQQAMYMKVHYNANSLSDLLGNRLRKIEIECSARSEIITRVSEMRITHRLLFRDLDGAARTATQSVFGRLV